jgi:hypothetical protein
MFVRDAGGTVGMGFGSAAVNANEYRDAIQSVLAQGRLTENVMAKLRGRHT